MNFDENLGQFKFTGVVDSLTLVITFILCGSVGDIQHLMSDLLLHSSYNALVNGQFSGTNAMALINQFDQMVN